MLRLWRWYRNCLSTHPVKTQVISSGVLWGTGDIAAQTVTHFTAKPLHRLSHHVSSLIPWCCDKKLKINWKRVATTTFFGLGFVGPVGHFW
ncbi:hypothetical protein M569_08790, partial [Genlisea aurea]